MPLFSKNTTPHLLKEEFKLWCTPELADNHAIHRHFRILT
jgi:hypothetical protein